MCVGLRTLNREFLNNDHNLLIMMAAGEAEIMWSSALNPITSRPTQQLPSLEGSVTHKKWERSADPAADEQDCDLPIFDSRWPSPAILVADLERPTVVLPNSYYQQAQARSKTPPPKKAPRRNPKSLRRGSSDHQLSVSGLGRGKKLSPGSIQPRKPTKDTQPVLHSSPSTHVVSTTKPIRNTQLQSSSRTAIPFQAAKGSSRGTVSLSQASSLLPEAFRESITTGRPQKQSVTVVSSLSQTNVAERSTSLTSNQNWVFSGDSNGKQLPEMIDSSQKKVSVLPPIHKTVAQPSTVRCTPIEQEFHDDSDDAFDADISGSSSTELDSDNDENTVALTSLTLGTKETQCRPLPRLLSPIQSPLCLRPTSSALLCTLCPHCYPRKEAKPVIDKEENNDSDSGDKTNQQRQRYKKLVKKSRQALPRKSYQEIGLRFTPSWTFSYFP